MRWQVGGPYGTKIMPEGILPSTQRKVTSPYSERTRTLPPASVPIWYDYTPGGNVRVTTGATSRKARLIKKAGAVALVVQNEEPPYQYVTVEGSVVDATTPTPPDVSEAIAVRYLGDEGGKQFVQSMEGHENVLFTIRPDRWLSADFSE